MRNLNLPNRLTLLRMLLVPVFIACFYLHAVISWWNWLAAAVFVIAAATDLVDGYIARSRQLVTSFGKLMDPMADKLLFCSAFIMLTWQHRLPAILCIIFIARELVISGFRLVTAASGTVIAAGPLGKLKTALQAVGIVLLLLNNPIFEQWGIPLDAIVILLAAVVTVWSAADYIIRNRKAVNWN